MNWLDDRPDGHARTASRLVDGEAVIILPEQGVVKMLNAVGSRIWELADGTHRIRDIVEAIYEEVDVDRERAEQDVMAFVQEMVEADLLVVEGAP
jgi:reverse gyrase